MIEQYDYDIRTMEGALRLAHAAAEAERARIEEEQRPAREQAEREARERAATQRQDDLNRLQYLDNKMARLNYADPERKRLAAEHRELLDRVSIPLPKSEAELAEQAALDAKRAQLTAELEQCNKYPSDPAHRARAKQIKSELQAITPQQRGSGAYG